MERNIISFVNADVNIKEDAIEIRYKKGVKYLHFQMRQYAKLSCVYMLILLAFAGSFLMLAKPNDSVKLTSQYFSAGLLLFSAYGIYRLYLPIKLIRLIENNVHIEKNAIHINAKKNKISCELSLIDKLNISVIKNTGFLYEDICLCSNPCFFKKKENGFVECTLTFITETDKTSIADVENIAKNMGWIVKEHTQIYINAAVFKKMQPRCGFAPNGRF